MDLNLNQTADRVQKILNNGKTIVYIDRDFYLKDRVYKTLDDKQCYILTEDPGVMDLYRMYEFSDKIIVFSESCQYGSIWNYVKNGLLTEQEAIDTLLGN